jgi:hypothetical protein
MTHYRLAVKNITAWAIEQAVAEYPILHDFFVGALRESGSDAMAHSSGDAPPIEMEKWVEGCGHPAVGDLVLLAYDLSPVMVQGVGWNLASVEPHYDVSLSVLDAAALGDERAAVEYLVERGWTATIEDSLACAY